ncbi:nucleotidyl transferase AbiEii/AbiGii toxin family protein [Enterococcus sp. 669A]|uniref:Nucleotidyl transferase AbiEii/AbiGii toxin family protein n=1 Tax=Candidatus Enterococcus moelleringii TaxID=2815325 RepID=A0ABS3L7C4_9ENTE|nr:nucleotidyl transferase AbiEii/AbiGii toxin family protein [Enterococcus sp. 669A]MBO1305527.1 nucleotidyl transferase AbiEii/AbiGii toxin family protein [Enterococcus sp. 669A]
MYLYENELIFRDFIVDAAERFQLNEEIVEKDYFVSLILKVLAHKNSNIVFKGGTSLSKAYQIIERFSEDIDLSYYVDSHGAPGNSKKKLLKNQIIDALVELGFALENEAEIRSRRSFNSYYLNYSALYNSGTVLKPMLVIETYCHNCPFPVDEKEVSNYIYQFLKEKNLTTAIDDFPELLPFKMSVQALERTFVDKLFAICDKYLQNTPNKYSRHLYDLVYLSKRNLLDFAVIESTFKEVRKLLSKDPKHNPSSGDVHNIQQLVIDSLEADFFKEDYEKNTRYLAAEIPLYEDVKSSLLITMDQLTFLKY